MFPVPGICGCRCISTVVLRRVSRGRPAYDPSWPTPTSSAGSRRLYRLLMTAP